MKKYSFVTIKLSFLKSFQISWQASYSRKVISTFYAFCKLFLRLFLDFYFMFNSIIIIKSSFDFSLCIRTKLWLCYSKEAQQPVQTQRDVSSWILIGNANWKMTTVDFFVSFESGGLNVKDTGEQVWHEICTL